MKNEKLHTWLCATGLSFCLGLGAVGSMTTGLELPVELAALVIICAILAAIIAGLTYLRYGSLICLSIGGIMLLNPDFILQFKTLAAAVAMRLYLGYGIPIPEFLEEELADQVLAALCIFSGLIAVATSWAVQKQKTALPAVLLSLLPLACCITVLDTVPHSAFLFLWGLGLILLLMTQGVRHESTCQGNRLTALLTVPAVLVLVLLFWLVPRNAPDRWSIAQLPDKILSHFSGPGLSAPETVSPPQIDLSALEQRQQQQTPVMDVTADFTGALYLRSRDYDQYTGTGWYSIAGRSEELYGFDPQWHEKDGTVKISVRQPCNFFYVPAITQQPQLTTGGLLKNEALTTYYQFDHCSLREDWLTAWDPAAPSVVNPRYLTLPDNTQQAVLDYLDNLEEPMVSPLQEATTPDAAQWVRSHLRQLVPYNLNTPNMPADKTDLALWFLEEATSGYCVHYATAAAVLLRACGIPARYVEGYAVHVEAGKPVTVRELHAHAWVEYYVNGVGWLVLEATPGGVDTPQEPEATQPTQTQPVTTTAPTEPTTPTSTPVGTEKKPVQPQKELPQWVKPTLLTLFWCLGALTLFWAQYRLRRKLFRGSISRGSPNKRALRLYQRLDRLCKWTKKPVPAELTELAQKARFSQHTLTKGELSRLQGHLQLAEAALSLLPLHKRLIAKWLFARF